MYDKQILNEHIYLSIYLPPLHITSQLSIVLHSCCACVSGTGLTINRTGPHRSGRTAPDRTGPPGAPHGTALDHLEHFQNY